MKKIFFLFLFLFDFALCKDEVVQLYLDYCKNGDIEACVDVSLLYLENNQTQKAWDFSKKACDMNSSEGCYNLGVLSSGIGKLDDALAFFKQSCDMNYYQGCHNLATLYITNKISQDDVIPLLEKSCSNGIAISCTSLGVLHFMENNKGKARNYIKSGCDGGDDTACNALNAMDEKETEIATEQKKKNSTFLSHIKDFISLVFSYLSNFLVILLPVIAVIALISFFIAKVFKHTNNNWERNMGMLLIFLSLFYVLNFTIMMLSAVVGIWFLTSGILWAFFTAAVFLWPFWWVVELIKFGELSIFGVINIACLTQGIVMLIFAKIVDSKIAKRKAKH